uniref:FAM65 N-terminal domain-containing protein n=1 Tax=Callorhinchus milii TaxID=7868 RepID=A0A4W3JIF7_CALMI
MNVLLSQQIRMSERYIRRLEFHISRIEELHESYCIQWRLRDGANNMKQAYSVSPSTKGSRESLIQINRNCKEFTVFIRCAFLGLVGFARLCPGDQYEVLIRYGRQRWKLKGRIEADDRQMWDEEEVMFLPHINEDVEIKVAEMKGLMTVLVGTVTCESADFFTAQPQIMIVDITELGTIKLQLEVMWNPFDTDELSAMSGSVNKYSVSSRKGSLYNWTPPSTPSFRDKYFPVSISKWINCNTVRCYQVGQVKEITICILMLNFPLSVIPKAQKVKLLSSFWRKCAGTECVLYSSTERFLTQLRNYYTQKVNAKCLGLSERVFRTLLHQIAGCCGFLLSASLSEEVLTIFQFFNYVKRHSITDLGTHLMKLTKEVSLAEALQTTQKIKTLKKLKGKHITEFQPLHQTLESISILQLDENPKVIQAAKSFLSNASVHRHFRDKALAHYTDALQDKDLQIQKSACMALKHLKAVESIEQIVSLCQSETKDVRDTARETILSFGEKGHLAFEKLEKMWYDLEEDRIQNETTQITIL